MELSFAKSAERLRVLPATDGNAAVCAVCGTACAKPERVYRQYSRRGETLCMKCDLTYDKLEHEEQYEPDEVQEDK